MNKDKNIISLNGSTISINSDVSIYTGAYLLAQLAKLIKESKAESIVLDLSEIKKYDTFLIIFINSFIGHCQSQGKEYTFISFDGNIKSFYDKFNNSSDNKQVNEVEKTGYTESIGNTTIKLYKDFISYVEFIGELFIYLFKAPFNLKEIRWVDFPHHFVKSGINSIPIVVLIVFLIGLITGYQGAMQLSQFGADKYIADLIGISITRELAPLMAAILIAGRSGSSFAAEIGTMKVSEEIDSLKTMGFDIMNFLVLPRIFAVVVAIPFITLIADFAGVMGGLIAAISTLDVTVSSYLTQLNMALSFTDVFSGLFKSVVFGFIIAAVGCFRGLQVGSGADSVGKYTTASVVTSVFLVILIDAVFTFLFQSLGI